ncbi:hypothetical protein BDZ97DRAFT_1775501, partial [Flammula alnicola]
MSARTQQVGFMPTTTAFASPPIFLPTSPSPAVHMASGNGPFAIYPPQYDDGDDEQLLHILCIISPYPSVNNPTLLGLTDTLLTAEILPNGVTTETTDLDIYTSKTGYAPRMVDHDLALRLSTTLAVKCNGEGEQWSHYIDNQHITPNVRVVDESHLYVVFHVCEYPTARTVRSLSVEVSATWQKEEVEKKAKEEAERKARKSEEEGKGEEERRAREAEERRAREEEKQARKEEKQAREEERVARKEEREAREEERRASQARKPSVANAPDVADEKMQAIIGEAMDRLGLENVPADA